MEPHVMDNQKNQSSPVDEAQNTVEIPQNGEFSVREGSKNLEDEQRDFSDTLIFTSDSDSSGSDSPVADKNGPPTYSGLGQWPPLEAKRIVSVEPEPESNHQRYEETRPVMSAVPFQNNHTLIVGAGLLNLGNTCFLNAVLQAVMHTMALLQLFSFHNHVLPCYGCLRGFCLFSVFREVIEVALFSMGGIVSPWKLVDNLSYFSSSFRRYQQEDAHEFLQCFLNKLERCCPNIVKQVFGGRLVSKLRCCTCGHCSNTYEPLIDVSLEIKDVESLTAALESFTSVEKIKYSCEGCKAQVAIEKQLMLDKAPDVAAFHLKRFATSGSSVEKVDKQVSFPLELDLLPYTDNSQKNNEQMMYDLYAVIVHAGASSSSGHYYCYIRSAPNEWYKFDDSQVFQVLEDLVLIEEAYILFYAKRGSLWFSDLLGMQKNQVDPPKTDASPSPAVDNVKETTVQTSTPVPTVAVKVDETSLSRMHQENATDDIGLIERMATFSPKTPSRAPSHDKVQMDLEQELEMKPTCSLIKKRVSGSRGEELMDALRGSDSESSLNDKKRKLEVSSSKDERSSADHHSSLHPVVTSNIR